MDVDMDGKFHIHGNPGSYAQHRYADFHGRDAKLKITAHDQNHGKSHGDHEYVIIVQC